MDQTGTQPDPSDSLKRRLHIGPGTMLLIATAAGLLLLACLGGYRLSRSFELARFHDLVQSKGGWMDGVYHGPEWLWGSGKTPRFRVAYSFVVDWEVTFEGPDFTDEDLAKLCRIQDTIDTLKLNHTTVTEAGLDQLKALTSLEELYLKGSRVSETKLRELKVALPMLEVFAPGIYDDRNTP
jgi:hypothetical protein